MSIYQSLNEAVQAGDTETVTRLTREALDQGLDPEKVLDEGLMPGMEEVGKKFTAGELFIPEVLMSGEALKASMEIIQPRLSPGESSYRGKVLLATVAGDIHDLGKNLVGMNLTANGFEVIDLGTDVTAEEIIQAVKDHKPDFLGLSALLTTTMPEMEKIVDLMQKSGLDKSCKTIIGGAPVSEEFARDIKADLYAENAIEAISVIKEAL